MRSVGSLQIETGRAANVADSVPLERDLFGNPRCQSGDY